MILEIYKNKKIIEDRIMTDKKIASLNQEVIISILDKVKEAGIEDLRIMKFSDLYSLLDEQEIVFMKGLMSIDPKIHGFKGAYFGIHEADNDLILISGQRLKVKDKTIIISTQYLPKKVFDAYKKLNYAMHSEIKKEVLVESGYRSPAYQAIVFLRNLMAHDFDFQKTISRVALPGYSEHGYSKKQAIDFATRRASSTNEGESDFSGTEEYEWLTKNAGRFGFSLSYPKGNDQGVIFEPWHWHYDDK